MRKILVLAAALAAAIAFARPADAQTLTNYTLIDSAQHNYKITTYYNSTTTQTTPASVSSDSAGNPLSGTIGITNPNNTALFVQGVTNGLPLLTSFSAPQHIICDSGCGGGGGGGLSVPYGGAIGANGTPGGFKDGSGNFQPLLGDVTNGEWVNIKASVSIPVTGTFFQATQPVSGSVSIAGTATIAGTVTANAGTNLNTSLLALETGGNLASINTKTPALGQALASASVPIVLTASQLTTLTPLSTVTVTQATGTNLHIVCDSGCSGSGGTSSTIGATYPTIATAVGMSQGGNMVAMTGTSGNLNVQCANCSGSGASAVDEATITFGTSVFAPMGGAYQTTATSNPLVSGQQGMAQLTINRAVHMNLRNSTGVEIGNSTTPLQVSLANTGANGTAIAVSLASTTVTGTVAVTQSTSPWIVAGGGTAGAPGTAVLTIQGVASGTNVPTSHASGSVASGAYASGSIGAGAVAAGAYVSGSVLSGAYASGALVDITNVSTPIAPNTATATKGILIGGQFNTTQETLTTGQQGQFAMSSRGALFVATGADTFNVTVNAALPAGTNLMGKVGIDQTTVGTTNGVSIAQIGATTVSTGNGTSGAGNIRVNIASDNTAFAVNATLQASSATAIGTVNPTTPANWSFGATGSAVPANATYSGMNVAGNLTGFVGKAASTAAAATDVSLVTNESPNSQLSVAIGTSADAPCTLPATTTACSQLALAKATANAAANPLAAGTAIIGKVGIDQTTPGTTNGVAPSTPVGTAAFAATQVSVGSAATSILSARTGAPGTGRASATVTNTTTTAIFIGGSGVTTSTGTLLPGIVGASITINTTAAIFGIVATGTATVTALESF